MSQHSISSTENLPTLTHPYFSIVIIHMFDIRDTVLLRKIDADTTANHSSLPQSTAPAVQPTRPVTGGFTAVNAPPPLSQVRKGSVPTQVRDTSSPETIKVAHKHTTGYASGSASPALNQGNGMPGQGVMSRSNFPHPGAVVIDQ